MSIILENFTMIQQKNGGIRLGHQFVVEFHGLERIDRPKLKKLLEGLTKNNLSITYYIQSASIPQVEIGSAHVDYMAAGFELPGVIKYPDQWSTKIILDQGLTYYNILREWQEYMSSYWNNSGGDKRIPNVTAKVTLLNSAMDVPIRTYFMEGVWIESLGNIDFEYKEGSSDIQMCTCNFAFQYWYENKEGNPLDS